VPTNSGSGNDKDAFYSALSCEIEQVPANDYVVVAGEFNAQLGPPVKSI